MLGYQVNAGSRAEVAVGDAARRIFGLHHLGVAGLSRSRSWSSSLRWTNPLRQENRQYSKPWHETTSDSKAILSLRSRNIVPGR